MHPHLSRNVPQYHMPVFQLHAKRRIWQILNHLTLHLNDIIF